MHPGVADGDSAELQWAGPLLGICHSPGYALQVSFLKLFGALPIGGSLAWRANVMSAVFGIFGCLALYGSVRRITGGVLPGCIAATTLAFSSVFWSHALVAETYVFGASFILVAVYSAVRFVESDRSPWLWATALLLGVAVAERLPELLIVPAFLALWLAFRRRARLDWRRASVCAGLMALPFVLAVGLNVARSDPERIPARDDALRDAIIGYHPHEVTYDYGAGPGLVERLQSATSFVLGVRWSARVGASHVGGTSLKYAWLLSGLGVWGDRFAPEVDHDFMLRGGTSLGALGVLLALAGVFFWRRRPGWVLLGLGLWAGNLAFVLLYYSWDNLTFTVPSLAGLALLAGLGAAGPPSDADPPPRRRRIYTLVCLIAPLALLLTNFRYVDRNTEAERANVEQRQRIAQAAWPPESVIMTTYWPAMTYRYLLRVEVERLDVLVLHTQQDTWSDLARHFLELGRPLFFTPGMLPPRIEAALLRETPLEFARLGFILIDPKQARSPSD
jgi:4-amino-4-deoxy-L-arabinose transferase-like glycosyltransferase